MITAYLIGDQQLLERLRALQSVANSGLVRGITQLGIDLQGLLQQGYLDGGRRPQEPRTELSVEQSGGTITASVRTDLQTAVAREHGLVGTSNVRANLRRSRAAFVRPNAKKAIGAPTSHRGPGLSERSFLRSALDSMTPAVRDGIEATLAEAMAQ